MSTKPNTTFTELSNSKIFANDNTGHVFGQSAYNAGPLKELVAINNEKVYSFDMHTGMNSLPWSTIENSIGAFKYFKILGDMVWLVDQQNLLAAIISNGSGAWYEPTLERDRAIVDCGGAQILGDILLFDSYVWVMNTKGDFYSVDPTNGLSLLVGNFNKKSTLLPYSDQLKPHFSTNGKYFFYMQYYKSTKPDSDIDYWLTAVDPNDWKKPIWQQRLDFGTDIAKTKSSGNTQAIQLLATRGEDYGKYLEGKNKEIVKASQKVKGNMQDLAQVQEESPQQLKASMQAALKKASPFSSPVKDYIIVKSVNNVAILNPLTGKIIHLDWKPTRSSALPNAAPMYYHPTADMTYLADQDQLLLFLLDGSLICLDMQYANDSVNPKMSWQNDPNPLYTAFSTSNPAYQAWQTKFHSFCSQFDSFLLPHLFPKKNNPTGLKNHQDFLNDRNQLIDKGSLVPWDNFEKTSKKLDPKAANLSFIDYAKDYIFSLYSGFKSLTLADYMSPIKVFYKHFTQTEHLVLISNCKSLETALNNPMIRGKDAPYSVNQILQLASFSNAAGIANLIKAKGFPIQFGDRKNIEAYGQSEKLVIDDLQNINCQMVVDSDAKKVYYSYDYGNGVAGLYQANLSDGKTLKNYLLKDDFGSLPNSQCLHIINGHLILVGANAVALYNLGQ